MTSGFKKYTLIVIGFIIIVVAITVFNANQTAPQTSIDGESSTKKQSPTLLATTSTVTIASPKDVTINSLDELKALFDSLNYNNESWMQGNREVPRLTFESVSETWQHTSNQIPVQTKKMVFFRLMAPLILVANENVLAERDVVKSAALDDRKLIELANKYRIKMASEQQLTEAEKQDLLAHIDIIPPSLALAQAAEESGWATSRFTVEGNAFFGQWDFSGNGMIPKQQRKELGNYGLARFDTPLASVEGYVLNINRNAAYQKLRQLRAQLRQDGEPITGMQLATTLDKYSERGQDYIDGIRSMISYNKLQQVDEAYLSDQQPLHLISAASSKAK
ncbi:glucosaminidase domain-containing protein [Shewanella waksmanii]|uniref:glucosaminidase domain-containing protein n=1 Tax=Shewanella waksmanii TaxID=213783 RepID=UPI0037359814